MSDGMRSGNVIDPSTPDSAVPAERVSTAHAGRRAASREKRFLKGPILLTWIREHVRHPPDRLLLVLVAHADMLGANELTITRDILEDAGIADRKAAYRAIDQLEARGFLAADRNRGRRPRVRILNPPKP